jgi:hypothetical protein
MFRPAGNARLRHRRMDDLPGALQVPLSSLIIGAVVSAAVVCPHHTVGVQSLRPRGPILGPSSLHFGSWVFKETLGGMIGVAPD